MNAERAVQVGIVADRAPDGGFLMPRPIFREVPSENVGDRIGVLTPTALRTLAAALVGCVPTADDDSEKRGTGGGKMSGWRAIR